MKKKILLIRCAFAVILLTGCGSRIEVYESVSDYSRYMSFGVTDENSAWYKWGVDESIWPESIKDEKAVSEYRMVRYDPWDAQYLGYLVMDLKDADYDAEVKRLRKYPSTPYTGIYSVREEETYELLAVNADEYHGFVYALTDGRNRIIYAEQIFCNFFLDLDCEKYIPREYLLDGFDAGEDNPYRKMMMGEE